MAEPAAADGHLTPVDVTNVIRAKLASGTLPRIPASKVWGGMGRGGVCAGCDGTINGGQAELEVELASTVLIPFHRTCFTIWDAERVEAPRGIAGGSAPSPWSSFFDARLARRAAASAATHAQLPAASAESRAMASRTRKLSAATRMATARLRRHHADRCGAARQAG